MTTTKPKSFYAYQNGYINIDETRVYFSSEGNWGVLKSAKEKNGKRTTWLIWMRKRILELLGIALFVLVLYQLGIAEGKLNIGGGVFVLYLFTILHDLWREERMAYYIEKSKITEIEADGYSLKLTFKNAQNKEETKLIKGLSVHSKFLVYHPYEQSMTNIAIEDIQTDLEAVFTDICLKVCADRPLIQQCYEELNTVYHNPGRHYHNMQHIRFFYHELLQASHLCHQWDEMVMAMFYHDAVYNPLQKDNEYQSAMLASQHLEQMQFPDLFVGHVRAFIMATQTHQPNTMDDMNLFVDADLAILGSTPEQYARYVAGIRQEYAMYNDEDFNKGREAVVQKMLTRSRIYTTNWFYERYEAVARYNLTHE